VHKVSVGKSKLSDIIQLSPPLDRAKSTLSFPPQINLKHVKVDVLNHAKAEILAGAGDAMPDDSRQEG
jgi:hypothetical protein